MGLVQAIEAAGLERPHRQIVAEQGQEMRADERLTEPAMNEEHRRRTALFADRKENRHRFRKPRGRPTASDNRGGDAGDAGILVRLRQAHPELVEQPRLQLDQRQRIAAEQEEIVATSYRSLFEQRLKYLRDRS